MKPTDLEERMRVLEYFSPPRMVPACWPIVRLDRRGFSRMTAARFGKPFDPRFRDLVSPPPAPC